MSTSVPMSPLHNRPSAQGLYAPENEHDSCGVGFVGHISGEKSHKIVKMGLDVLLRMRHRGATGADPQTGDGAGITIQMPTAFFRTLIPTLPAAGRYGSGLVFLPQSRTNQTKLRAAFDEIIGAAGLAVITWREVAINPYCLGSIALSSMPAIWQVFVGKPDGLDGSSFERKLFIVRKKMEKRARALGFPEFHVPSLSAYTFVYKGLFLPHQLGDFYFDLRNPDVVSGIALVHSRFSTNTFPTWELAQPFRMIAHNGEINTIKSNVFWMQARQAVLKSLAIGDDLASIFPIIEPDKSDSMGFDNVLELLVMAGRSLPESMMMMIPESWNRKNPIPDSLKAFYAYYATMLEPWDGPATVAFTDGRLVGAALDRNGLRPARYIVTKDNIVIMASEVGVQDIPADQIIQKNRVRPGKMILLDTEAGRLITDSEIKFEVSSAHPYREWLSTHCIELADMLAVFPSQSGSQTGSDVDSCDLARFHAAFGYDAEELKMILAPMCADGKEPVGSMGNDTPIAVLSRKPQRLFAYFKQLFAQVTNPAIDPIREVMVMSLISYIGAKGNILATDASQCTAIKLRNPVLTNSEMDAIRHADQFGFPVAEISMVFPVSDGETGLEVAVANLCDKVASLVREGKSIIVLTDMKIDENFAPIPALLAVSALHHHLVRDGLRTKASIVVKSGECREVMHFGLLFGYGADAVNPYLALSSISLMKDHGLLSCSIETAVSNYIHAVEAGILKILSKMGISTIRSYRGSQLYEALGLSSAVIDRYFTGTVSRIEGIDITDIAKEALLSHGRGIEDPRPVMEQRPFGVYKFTKDGEFHAWNPQTVRLLQKAVRQSDWSAYTAYSEIVNSETRQMGTLRGLLEITGRPPIPVSDVESVESILRRFTTGAMSYGALSREAHEVLAIAMNRLGGRSNSGEGGESADRFVPRADGTSARSAIKQVASGRFGVTSHYLVNADEIQIKISQGAKPGEGGQLPGHKIDEIIAKVRHATPGVSLISPPPHHDIYSIEDLAQLIFDLKNVNPAAAISVKLVSESGVGTVAAGVAKAYSDLITISGYDGGTGASPLSSIRHAGVPWELGLSETQQTLVLNRLRGRVRLQVDGQMKTGRDVIIAAMLGAEEYGFSTAALISVGCVMVRQCHLNNCPTGVATQDPELRKKFSGNPDHVVAFFQFVAKEVRQLLADLGFNRLDDIVGHPEYLKFLPDPTRWKTQKLDFSKILYRPSQDLPVRQVERQVHALHMTLDRELLILVQPAIQFQQPVHAKLPIQNVNRSVGAMMGGVISQKYGAEGLPPDTINLHFVGSAGQSFGAWIVNGMTFELEGDANDYLGKGLSGGKIIVYPSKQATFKAVQNVIVGNTTLYGATSGEAYIAGIAGERFAIRNSGAITVVEGVGDHGCEYMTGGRVVVLGSVGRNFAAGMSGGIAYVYDPNGQFAQLCNDEMVELVPVESEEQEFLHTLIENHHNYTGSERASGILSDWSSSVRLFVKVLPLEYKSYLAKQKDIELVEFQEG